MSDQNDQCNTQAVFSKDAIDIDIQTQAQLEEIESKIKKEQKLTSQICSLSMLEQDYQGTANFISGIKALHDDYNQMRLVRGDGNCYYRAFLYSLAEAILNDPNNLGAAMLKCVKDDTWRNVLAAGYDEIMLEVFYDSIVDLLERLVEEKLSAEQLHDEMNQETATSDYCTWYLRVVTAVHLKSNADRFLPFMEEGMDVETFCKANVEPMGKECENVQVLALAEALGIQVVIAYLDGHDLLDGKVTQHAFGPSDGARAKLFFLYRPGHYDIIYPKESTLKKCS